LDLKDSEINLALGLLSECADVLPRCFWTERISNLHFRDLISEIGRACEEETKDLFFNYGSLLFPEEASNPPFETYYRSPSERRGCLESLEMMYSSSLFTVSPHRELSDHIAVELHFLHLLSVNEAESILEEHFDSAAHFRRLQSIFLWKHLRAWLPSFNKVTGTANSSKFAVSLSQAIDFFTELDAMYLSFLLIENSDLFTELNRYSNHPG
jgi:TorA maturation chaperone TorD